MTYLKLNKFVSSESKKLSQLKIMKLKIIHQRFNDVLTIFISIKNFIKIMIPICSKLFCLIFSCYQKVSRIQVGLGSSFRNIEFVRTNFQFISTTIDAIRSHRGRLFCNELCFELCGNTHIDPTDERRDGRGRDIFFTDLDFRLSTTTTSSSTPGRRA